MDVNMGCCSVNYKQVLPAGINVHSDFVSAVKSLPRASKCSKAIKLDISRNPLWLRRAKAYLWPREESHDITLTDR